MESHSMCFDYRMAKGVDSSEMWDGIAASMSQVVLNIVVCECSAFNSCSKRSQCLLQRKAPIFS
jgi:hypothetical protein